MCIRDRGDGGIPAVNRLPVGGSVRLIVGEGHQGPCPIRQKKIAFLVPIAGQEVRQHVHLADARAPPLLDPPCGQRDLQAIAGQRVLQGERKILLGPCLLYTSFPGAKWIFQLIILSLMFNATVTAIPNFLIMSGLGWVDTYKAIIVPAMGLSLIHIWRFS